MPVSLLLLPIILALSSLLCFALSLSEFCASFFILIRVEVGGFEKRGREIRCLTDYF
jgi:hypothetical protein